MRAITLQRLSSLSSILLTRPGHARGCYLHVLFATLLLLDSIERWLGPGKRCPICHDSLPPELLKLYYEHENDHATAGAATASQTSTAEPGTGEGEGETVSASTLTSAEVTQLRRKLASSDKVGSLPLLLQRSRGPAAKVPPLFP